MRSAWIDYRYERARERRRRQLEVLLAVRTHALRWMLLLLALGLTFLLGFATGTAHAAQGPQAPFRTEVEAQLPCLELQVRPRIMLPLSRQDVRIELRVRRHADHRQLSVAWDGGAAGGGSSAQTLHGEDEPALFVRTLKNQPAAAWQFVAAVSDAQGRILGRRTAAIVMPEGEP